MITEYINTSGKNVVIAEMPDAYLLNSYAKYHKRIVELDSKELGKSWWVAQYRTQVNDVVVALRAEIDKRGLV